MIRDNLHARHRGADSDTTYEPSWMHNKSRGFHDLARASTQEVLDLVQFHLPSNVKAWGFSEKGLWWFNLGSIWLRLDPCVNSETFLVPEVINVPSAFRADTTAALRILLSSAVRQAAPNLEKLMDIGCLVLQLVEYASEACESLLNKPFFVIPPRWSNDALTNWKMLKWNRAGLNPMTVPDTCYDILKLTPTQICKLIPDEYRILKMESVRDPLLAERFLNLQGKLRYILRHDSVDTLRKKLHPHTHENLERRNLSSLSREEVITELTRPRTTFHGTARQLVPLIVKHGFLKPGSESEGKIVVNPRSGTVASRPGIYSSPWPSYAMSYSRCHSTEPISMTELPGYRLFVCAVLTGRTLAPGSDPVDWDGIHGPCKRGFDSHFDGHGEYIVHNSHAILPCYVVHLDLKSEQAKLRTWLTQKWWTNFYSRAQASEPNHAALTSRIDRDLDTEHEKLQARRAAAAKFLALGFGGVASTSLQVQDIASVEEDQEPWSEEYYEIFWEQDVQSSGWKPSFWNTIWAGRGERWEGEPEFAIPINFEKLLYL